MALVHGGAAVRRRLLALPGLVRRTVGPRAGERAMEVARREISLGPWFYVDRDRSTRDSVTLTTSAARNQVRTVVFTDVAYGPVLEYQGQFGREREGRWFGPAWRRVRDRVGTVYVSAFEEQFHLAAGGLE